MQLNSFFMVLQRIYFIRMIQSIVKYKRAYFMAHSFYFRGLFRNQQCTQLAIIDLYYLYYSFMIQPSFMFQSWMLQVWFTFRRAFFTIRRIKGVAHCTQPVSVPLPARPAICWISCSYKSLGPSEKTRSIDMNITFFILRFRPIPMALVATK